MLTFKPAVASLTAVGGAAGQDCGARQKWDCKGLFDGDGHCKEFVGEGD